MDRASKETLVKECHESLKASQLVVIAHYKGLTVAEMTDLRTRMREANVSFRVIKNSLLSLATEGTDFESLKDLFEGPTALAYSSDPVAAAKIAVKFAKDSEGKLVIRGGSLMSQTMGVEQIQDLAKLPSLDELRATLLGLIQAPATKIACVLKEPASKLARVLAMRPEQS